MQIFAIVFMFLFLIISVPQIISAQSKLNNCVEWVEISENVYFFDLGDINCTRDETGLEISYTCRVGD